MLQQSWNLHLPDGRARFGDPWPRFYKHNMSAVLLLVEGLSDI